MNALEKSLLAALVDLLGDVDTDNDSNGHCCGCGRELPTDDDSGRTLKHCDSDDCARVKARAVIASARRRTVRRVIARVQRRKRAAAS